MVLDGNLSENVPLSLILDELLRSNESPDVVMSFLKDCGDSLGEVLSRSICSSKMANLDFFRKISSRSGKAVFRKMIEDFLIGPQESWLFVVQLSRTGKDAVRNEMGMDPQKICQAASLTSPIPMISQGNCLDSLFLEPGSNVFYAAEKVNSSDDGEFDDFLKYSNEFLFHGRIFQEDFFLSLSAGKKWIFLNRMVDKYLYFSLPTSRIASNFFMQLACCSDLDVRREMFRLMTEKGDLGRIIMEFSFPWFGDEDKDSVLCANSFPELYMEYSISGIEGYVRPILVLLMAKRKFSMLKEFVESEPDLVEKYLPIGDFLGELFEDKK